MILSGFLCFPQAGCTPAKAVGLWGAPGPKPCVQIRYCGAVLGPIHHCVPAAEGAGVGAGTLTQ